MFSSEFEFRAWPKTPRLNRGMVVTEKIDGTNGAIIVSEDGRVGAQSRKRVLSPGKQTDNFGFARWVEANADELADLLGVGYHYGEWWGSGIQRGYGLTGGEKRFSLFNVERYQYIADDCAAKAIGLGIVPKLYEGDFSTTVIDGIIDGLRWGGTHVEEAPEYFPAEGIIVYHEASRQVYKVLCDYDELPKGAVEAKASDRVTVAGPIDMQLGKAPNLNSILRRAWANTRGAFA